VEDSAAEFQQIANAQNFKHLGFQAQERQRQQKFLIGRSDIFAARSALLRTNQETDEAM
jgi:hypothetical protein